jgi:LysM repeat protein
VERYSLYRYDQADMEDIQVVEKKKVLIDESKNTSKVNAKIDTQKTSAMKIYEVKGGDTLTSLSKQFMLTVDELKKLNELENSNLFPGQLLLVSK